MNFDFVCNVSVLIVLLFFGSCDCYVYIFDVVCFLFVVKCFYILGVVCVEDLLVFE